jgi:hypothetical protein
VSESELLEAPYVPICTRRLTPLGDVLYPRSVRLARVQIGSYVRDRNCPSLPITIGGRPVLRFSGRTLAHNPVTSSVPCRWPWSSYMACQ